MVDSSYFFTSGRYDSFLKAKEKAEKHGTVGAVALDKKGNLAAGTSTGGMTYKMKGRVGDSPVIGSGTYADNSSCAVSATGHGEYFIRNVVAYDISAMMKYRKLSLKVSANEVIMKKLQAIGGEGGIIAVDKNGNVAMPFNTAGMYRGFITSEGKQDVMIYGKD
jgi:beta-aspartyl-peptidase (threonine type)